MKFHVQLRVEYENSFIASGPSNFYANFYKGDNFCEFLFSLLNSTPILKRGILSRRGRGEDGGSWSKFLPFKADYFSKGSENKLDKTYPHESVPVAKCASAH